MTIRDPGLDELGNDAEVWARRAYERAGDAQDAAAKALRLVREDKHQRGQPAPRGEHAAQLELVLAQRNELRAIVERKDAEIARLNESCDAGALALREKMAAVERLEQKVIQQSQWAASREATVGELTRQRDAAKADVKQLEAGQRFLSGRVSEVEAERDTAQLRLQETARALGDARAEADRAEERRVEVTRRYDVACAAAHERESHVERQREALAAVTDERDALDARLGSCLRASDVQAARVRQLEEQAAAANRRADAAQVELREKSRRIALMGDEADNLRADVSFHESRAEGLAADVVRLTQERDALARTQALVSEQLVASRLQSHVDWMDRPRGDCSVLEALNARLDARLGEALGRAEDAEYRLADEEKRVDGLVDEGVGLRARLAEAEDALVPVLTLGARLRATEDARGRLASLLSRCRSAIERTTAFIRSRELREQCEALTHEIDGELGRPVLESLGGPSTEERLRCVRGQRDTLVSLLARAKPFAALVANGGRPRDGERHDAAVLEATADAYLRRHADAVAADREDEWY